MNSTSFRQRVMCVCTLVYTAAVFGVPTASGQTSQGTSEPQEKHLIQSWIMSVPVVPSVLPQRTSETEAAATDTIKKLQQIIVPQVAFDHLPISEAVGFLRRESVRLDKDSPLDTQGVQISVRWWSPKGPQFDDKPNASPPPVPEPTVTLQASHLSLGKALRYLAGKIYARMEVTEEGVILQPFSITDPLFIDEFCVDPEKLGFPARMVAEARNFLPATEELKGTPTFDAKPFFRSKGFEFPEGSDAVYLPHIDRLIVRFDSEETMDKLATLVDQLSTPSIPSFTPVNP